MSRIGILTIENWILFSVLKTEMFENFEKVLRKWRLSNWAHLNRFIDWYNNERMLKKFNYKIMNCDSFEKIKI